MLRISARSARSWRGVPPSISFACRSAQSSTGGEPRPKRGLWAAVAAVVGGAGVAWGAGVIPFSPVPATDVALVNWSNTHEIATKNYYQPESIGALEKLVAWAHSTGHKIRPIGNALSPNGIGFSSEGMVNIALCDKVLSFDKTTGRLTVEGGARLSVVLDELRKHGWTLQNLASIKEQQVGGWIQAGCHGTGAGLPAVEEQVVAMKLVTPGKGTLELSEASNPRLFRLAKCGLGALGVVAEVTLQAVPIEPLAEQTTVQTLKQVKANHAKALKGNRHLRYMWIPFTDSVVVVTVNPISACPRGVKATTLAAEPYRLQPLVALLKQVRPDIAGSAVDGMNFADLRDHILAADPLNIDLVKKCNVAEAEFWKRSQGWRLGDNEALLGFECGGEQWVSECAFPVSSPNADITFIEETTAMIRESGIPAHAPIEQRWTASSTALMSPAHSADSQMVHSWVGIIMYLPTQDADLRKKITDGFFAYRDRWQETVQQRYGAVDHWAKVEVPSDPEKVALLQERLARRFPVAEFNAARRELDPKGILASPTVDKLFPPPAVQQAARYTQPKMADVEVIAATVSSNDPATA